MSERKALSGGTLKAASYDDARRVLTIEFKDGRLTEYSGVGREIARRFMDSAAPWSYFRDNIEDEFTGRAAGRAERAASDDNPFA
ncbi:MAG: KTSC domain-containing protein [Burkholderiales bacterium]|nr:KTSC domain-containing protein [Burkholderiales bacterium]